MTKTMPQAKALQAAVDEHRGLTDRLDQVRRELEAAEQRAVDARRSRDRDSYADATFDAEDFRDELQELEDAIRASERKVVRAEIEVAWIDAEEAIAAVDEVRRERDGLRAEVRAIADRLKTADTEARIDLEADRSRTGLKAERADGRAKELLAQACLATRRVDDLEAQLGVVGDGPGIRARPRRVTTTVHLRNPSTGERHAFTPGTRVPRWAALMITQEDVYDLGRLPAGPLPDWVAEEHPDWVEDQQRQATEARRTAQQVRDDHRSERHGQTVLEIRTPPSVSRLRQGR